MDNITIAVLSDIHSNLFALDACLLDAEERSVQEYIVLGDIVNIWHKPNECIERIRDLTPFTVMGLSEQKIRDARTFYDLWHLYDEFSSYIWTENRLTDANFDYISKLPHALSISCGDIKMLAVHGSPYKMSHYLNNESEESLNRILSSVSEDILLCAGSHSQMEYSHGGKTLINPGSVGCHHNGNKLAEYAVIEISDKLEKTEFRKVPYDEDLLFHDYLRSDLYKEGCIDVNLSYLGMITGRDEMASFESLIKEARSESEYSLSGPVPNEIYNSVYNKNYSSKIRSEILLPFEL